MFNEKLAWKEDLKMFLKYMQKIYKTFKYIPPHKTIPSSLLIKTLCKT
jgi:hypothetical protein